MKQYAKGYVAEVKGDGIVGAVASTGSLDRDGDVLMASGWILDSFKKNPVLLWAHDSYSLPIGKVTDIGVLGNELRFNAEFAIKENEFAAQVQKLMKGGFLNAFSVGFIPKQFGANGEINNMELLEISVVNVPANDEALQSREFKEFEAKVKEMEKKEPVKAEEKSGRMLSDQNRKLIANAMDSMTQAHGALESLMTEADAREEPKEPKSQPVSRSSEATEIKKVENPKADSMKRALRIANRAVEYALKELKNK